MPAPATMGNMPNRWAGRALAAGLAAFLGLGAYVVGMLGAGRLAYGFTFDWYVHPVARSFDSTETLLWTGLAAGIAALFAVAFVVPLVAALTRSWSARLRHVPPRYSGAPSLDVHGVRLALLLGAGMGPLAALVGYTFLATPLATGGEPLTRLSPGGFTLLVAAGAAFGAFVAALVAGVTTFSGIVSGHIVRRSGKNVIARISIFGMRNAKTTVALILGVTLVAGYYATTVTTNVDVADVMPRGDANTVAAHNLTDKFKSSFTQQVTWQFPALNQSNATHRALYEQENAAKLPDRRTEPKPENITDELYIRAIAEVIDWVTQQDPFVGSVGAPDFYKLINWTAAGGQTSQNTAGNASYAIPGTDEQGETQYATVDEAVNRVGAVYSAVDALTSPRWTQTAVLVTVSPNEDALAKTIGERALEVREEWLQRVRNGETQYKVFGDENPPLFSVDLPIANAHASELTKHDFTLLLPVIGVFIAVVLFIAFRNAVSVIATFSMLSIAVLWTFGAMGAMRIPLNTINLATVPLIMGVGIDYGIHMMNEYQEQRGEGKTAEEAWTYAGGGSALALFVGMLTTAAGLVVMIASPSLLVAQLGLLANIALLSCYTLAILFIPALTALLSREGSRTHRHEFQPSRIMPAFATAVSRSRWAVAVVLVLVAVASVSAAQTMRREAFGDPPKNWLPEDEIRRMHEDAILGFYDKESVKANVIIFEGDVTTPEAHDYIAGITSTLRANALAKSYVDESGQTRRSLVIADTLRDLPFLMNTYLTVRGGAPGVGQYLLADNLAKQFEARNLSDPTGRTQNYPQTEPEIRAVLDEVFVSPLYQFGNLFIDHPTYDMTVTIFSVEAATYEDAENVWNEVQLAIAANEDLRPEGMQVSFFGNTAINYLFVAKQVPWLTYMSIATNILIVIIVFAFTRNVRATVTVGAMNFLASALWLGALTLPFIDIGLAISLTLPLIFIFAMGSDYALHLSMRCRRTNDTYATFESVGKGVLYSFMTTFGSFLIFTRISDLAGRRSMIATAIAIGVVFVVTLLLVPILYPVKKGRHADRRVPVLETRSVEVWEGSRRVAKTVTDER